MSSIKVEKGIVIPPYYAARLARYEKQRGKTRTIFPFYTMEVGDSFLVPPMRNVGHFRTKALGYGQRLNKQFVVTFDSNHKIRCWRIK